MSVSWKTILSTILQVLLKVGPNAQKIMPLVMAIFEDVKAIADKINQLRELAGLGVVPSTDGTLNLVAPTEEEAAIEGQIAQLLAAPGAEAVWDFSRLRAIFAFLKSLGLEEILAGLLQKFLDDLLNPKG